MKTLTKVVAVASMLLFCSGCWYSEANNSGDKFGAMKHTEEGLAYKIVTIEGKRFIATQGSYGYWQLAGPIDCFCEGWGTK